MNDTTDRRRAPGAWRRGLGGVLRRLGVLPRPLLPATPSAAVEPDPPPGAVDVIVPVHGAQAAFAACLASLLRHTDLLRHRLVVVADGDPSFDAAAVEEARQARPGARIEVLTNDAPRGFVKSVNRAMALSHDDVVLLNSDTVVTARWLEKMQAAAYSDRQIATVTPFSNHATLCSLPQPFVANELPSGYDVDAFARLVEEVAAPEYPRLPTGVGMCLYVKRKVLDRLGLFDEERFGRGYGEESDFCVRALKAGYVHVLDDATFIFHEGEGSFRGEREARVRAAERVLRRLHPEYLPTIAAFERAGLQREARRRVRWALRRTPGSGLRGRRPRRVLHVVHGWPPYNYAGTELYARWLALWQVTRREVAVYARVADRAGTFGEASETTEDGLRVRLVVNNFVQRSPLARSALTSPRLERDFDGFLASFRPDLVHVHHLAGHALSLSGRVARRGLPLVYQVQDWWALCARTNLCHADGGACPGPSPTRCSACLPLTGLPPAALWNPLLYRYRRFLAGRSLALADAYVMGSRAIESDYRAAGLLGPEDRVYVLPYGVRVPPEVPPRVGEPALPLRFGYVGSIQPHKGLEVAVEAFRDQTPERAIFKIWGDPRIDPAYSDHLRGLAPPEVVELRGRFAEDEKSRIFGEMDVLLLPSLGLESFGLVAREALAHGVPVVASRRGALVELFPEDGAGGTWIEPGDVAGLRRLLDELVARPATVAEWRRRAPRVVSIDEHAREIEEVYTDVLEGR